MKQHVIFLIMLALPLASVAQEREHKEHFIEVTGSAQQEIEPNEIYTLIRLREFEENRQKTPLEQLDKNFLDALKKAGIDRKRLELADVGSRLDTFRRRDREAYRAKSYQIKLTSAEELDKLLTALESVKVDIVDITRVSHSDYEKIMLDLKVKALREARMKAETLMKSIDAEVGKPIMVREWDIRPFDGMEARMTMMKSADMQPAEPIGFRKIKLQAQVTAQFEIQ